MTPDEHLAPALDLIRANATQADRTGQLPRENIDALRAAGAFAWSRACELGGDQLSNAVKVRLWEAIGGADLATAWVWINYDWWVWELSGSRRLNPWPDLERCLREEHAMCGTSAPVPGTRIEGDEIVVNGSFPFATGCAFATWVRPIVVVPGHAPEVGPREGDRDSHIRSVILSLDHPGVRVERTWDSMGLRATHTDTVVADDVRVPLANSSLLVSDSNRRNPKFDIAGPYYREPGWAFTNSRIGACLVGAGQSAFDLALERLGGGRTLSTGRPGARFPSVRQGMAEAFIDLTAAREMLHGLALRGDERVASETPCSDAEEEALWASGTAASRMVLRALDQVLLALGANALNRDLPFERIARDIRTGVAHLALNQNFVLGRLSGYLFPEAR
jgi:alkylation response protein AidB-like acyl-CoA dehydrogenase